MGSAVGHADIGASRANLDLVGLSRDTITGALFEDY